MHGVEHATIGILILLAALLAPILWSINRARKGAPLYVRRIAGVDAVDQACGRAAELGRPISFSTGLTGVGPALYAIMGVLSHVARKAALFRSRLIIPQNDPQVMAICEDTARDAYRVEGRINNFDAESVVYLSDDQFAFASGYIGLIQRENVASTFLFGAFAAEALILAEAGQQIGAMQVAASLSPEQVSFFICTCDYTLIGDELYAASAFITREPVQLGSLYGQDRAKLVFLGLILIGVVIATINSIWMAKYGAEFMKNIDFFITWNGN